MEQFSIWVDEVDRLLVGRIRVTHRAICNTGLLRSAHEKGQTPAEFVDKYVKEFRAGSEHFMG